MSCTVTWSGRVIPEHLKTSIVWPHAVKLVYPSGEEGLFRLTIIEGRVTATVELAELDAELIKWGTIRALEFASTLVNFEAFRTGRSLSVVFDETNVEDEKIPLALSHRSVLQHIREYQPAEIELIQDELFDQLDLRLALGDLVSSLSTLNYSAIAACRAVETIRNLIAEPAVSDDKAWSQMRCALNLTKPFLTLITDASKNPRHGRRGMIDVNGQSEITHRAWAVMGRYFEFVLLGKPDTLPIDLFPTI